MATYTHVYSHGHAWSRPHDTPSSFVRSVHRTTETTAHFWNSVKTWTGLAWQWLAIWLVDFAKVLSFSSYVWLAHLDGQWTSLTTNAPIVDYLGTCRFHLNSRTALGVRRHLKKKPITVTPTSRSRPLDTPCLGCGQHFAVFWLAVQFQ